MNLPRTLPLVAGSLALGGAIQPATAADLSAGGYHVVRADEGLVVGLGDGAYGQLGSNPAGTPATVGGLRGITQVAAGGFSTLGLKMDGTVRFLGESTLQHTTPHGTPGAVSNPVAVAGLAGIDAIAAGHRHFLALDADSGTLYAWGHNGSGQVGNGSLLDVATPAVVLTEVASMAAGDGFSLAVKTDRTVWAWGRNTHGQLGLGDTADRLSPTRIPAITTADAVAAGGQHALILLTDDSVLAVGNNAFGQLGLGTTTPTSTPVTVPGLGGVTAVAAGYHHSAALGPAGQVSTWGRNYEGQCGGGGRSPVTYRAPTSLTGLPAPPTAIACGYHFTVFGLADGSAWGTGSNSDGQLDGISVADQDDSRKVLAPQPIPLGPDGTPPQQVILSTDFRGRTISGKTAGNISWTANGIQDPGDLTWALEGAGPTGTALFDTPDAQGHFAPDLNIGNEGPWSVAIPLKTTTSQIQVDDVILDWQHFNNSGEYQSVSRSADWTVSVAGSVSGLLGSSTASGVSGISGVETLRFSPPLTLSDAEHYHLVVFVNGSDSTGNNTGLDGMTVKGTIGSPRREFSAWISDPSFAIDSALRGFTDDPDRDGLVNGVEAWLGTHPGKFNAGLGHPDPDGPTTTLTHPSNDNPPSDLTGHYEWSPNLEHWYADGEGPSGGPVVSFYPLSNGATTTVTVTVSAPLETLYLRARVVRH